MADENGRARRSDYRGARVGAAAALISVIVLILIVDAFSPDYEASPIVLGALLGSAMTLLGIEVRHITGGKD